MGDTISPLQIIAGIVAGLIGLGALGLFFYVLIIAAKWTVRAMDFQAAPSVPDMTTLHGILQFAGASLVVGSIVIVVRGYWSEGYLHASEGALGVCITGMAAFLAGRIVGRVRSTRSAPSTVPQGKPRLLSASQLFLVWVVAVAVSTASVLEGSKWGQSNYFLIVAVPGVIFGICAMLGTLRRP